MKIPSGMRGVSGPQQYQKDQNPHPEKEHTPHYPVRADLYSQTNAKIHTHKFQ